MPAWFYILRLKSGSLYVGSSRNIRKRNIEHFLGTGCRTTKLDPPISTAYTERFETYKEASTREHQVKRWTRAKKEALIRGDIAELKRLSKRRTK